jgi:hypothetical protein
MGAGAKVQVGPTDRDQLRDPQPGLDRHDQDGMVSATGPTGAVRAGQERVYLGRGEEAHERLLGALGWDGEHPGDERRVLGVAQRGLSAAGHYLQLLRISPVCSCWSEFLLQIIPTSLD